MSALQDYKKMTNITLAQHPVAEQLQNCDSAESSILLVQSQAREFSDSPRSDRIMKSIKNTISVLCALTATASFGDAIDLVHPEAPMWVFHL